MSYSPLNKHSAFSSHSTPDDPCWDEEASHVFRPANPSTDRRAPCPGLNTLANHGYIPRSGTHITISTLLKALTGVYNLSLTLALCLTIPTFIIYGKFGLKGWPWHWSYTLDLASLAAFGSFRIAHRAALVHPNTPSHAPDPTLVQNLLSHSHRYQSTSPTLLQPSSPPLNEKPCLEGGLMLYDLAQLRVMREAELSQPLTTVHEQIALGESALTLLIFRDCNVDEEAAMVPYSFLSQWFGEERIPDGWTRPSKSVGLLKARKVAGQVQKQVEEIRSQQSHHV